MPLPSIAEPAPGDFRVTGSRAFVTSFQPQFEAFSTVSLSAEYPQASAPVLLLTADEAPTVDLVAIAQGAGVAVDGYRVTATTDDSGAGSTRLTANITDESGTPDARAWQLRGGTGSAVDWRLTFDDPAGAGLRYLVGDPHAELLLPAVSVGGDPLTLVAADPAGPAEAPAVIGALPPELAPTFVWSAADPRGGLPAPACTAAGALTIVPPSAPDPVTVTYGLTVTFGGTCPPTTAFLESVAAPASTTIGPRPPLPIGLLGDLSGPGAPFGRAVLAGAQLAVTTFNAGRAHPAARLVEYDTGGDPTQDTALAQQAAGPDRIAAMIGPAFTDSAGAVPAILESAAVPSITPSASDPALAGGGRRFWHRLLADDAQFAAGVVRFLARNVTPREVFVIDDGTPHNVRVAAAVAAAFAQAGTTVATGRFHPADVDFTAVLIRALSSDVVVHSGAIGKMNDIRNQAIALGLRALFVTGDLAGEPDLSVFTQPFPSPADGVVLATSCVLPGDQPGETAAMTAFTDAYRGAFGADPGRYSTAGYDAAGALLATVNAGAGTSDEVNRELATLSMTGVGGPVAFALDGGAAAPTVYFYRSRRAAIVPLGTADDGVLF